MNKIGLFMGVFTFSFSVFYGQNYKNSHVELTNGSVINGRIIENYPDSLIKIQTEGNNIWVFKYSEIDTVIISSHNEVKSNYPFNFKIETGVSVVGGSEFNPAFSLFLTGTYSLDDRFRIGITSGVEYFGISLLPVAGEIQADIFKRTTTPYIYLIGGYSFSLKPREENYNYISTYRGGIMYGAGIGIKKRFSSDFAMTFSVGYRRQNTYESQDYIYNDWWISDYERYYTYNRAAFMIGFVF